MAAGEKVQLVGFGTFEVKKREERVAEILRLKQKLLFLLAKFPGLQSRKSIERGCPIIPEKFISTIKNQVLRNLVFFR
jgi:hypothetical protein